MLAASRIGEVVRGMQAALEREHREQQNQREAERTARATGPQRGEAREERDQMPGHGDGRRRPGPGQRG